MPAPRSVEFDVSLSPLLIVRYEGFSTPEETREVLAQRSRWLHTRQRHVILHDLTRTQALGNTDQRRVQLDFVKAHLDLMREYTLGVAYIIDSAALRLVLSLVHHLQPLPMPQVYVRSMAEALPWSLDRLRQGGLEADAERLRLHFESASGRRSA
jgi:hypothetical protein